MIIFIFLSTYLFTFLLTCLSAYLFVCFSLIFLLTFVAFATILANSIWVYIVIHEWYNSIKNLVINKNIESNHVKSWWCMRDKTWRQHIAWSIFLSLRAYIKSWESCISIDVKYERISWMTCVMHFSNNLTLTQWYLSCLLFVRRFDMIYSLNFLSFSLFFLQFAQNFSW